jgi:hypothetical protein
VYVGRLPGAMVDTVTVTFGGSGEARVSPRMKYVPGAWRLTRWVIPAPPKAGEAVQLPMALVLTPHIPWSAWNICAPLGFVVVISTSRSSVSV